MPVFVWDERKRRSNIAKHTIDFRLAIMIWSGPLIVLPARVVEGEVRHIACGRLGSDVISVVFTERAGMIRIISARKARHHERKAFEDHARHS
ncbi:MAG: BrnT family toxin [Alphaproteobacteria bacterium]|nr:BrnT family toxin [Alphaproteobacteria bacterium]